MRIATLDEYRKDPDFAAAKMDAKEMDQTLYPRFKYEGYSWGMTIDLNKCVGCNACVWPAWPKTTRRWSAKNR